MDPAGAPAKASLDALTAVVFLTSSCRPCQAYWKEAPAGAAGGQAASIVYVTPDPSTESRRRVARLAAQAAPTPVIMSTEAWLAYGVTQAPWLVVVRDGQVMVDGPAPSEPGEVLAAGRG